MKTYGKRAIGFLNAEETNFTFDWLVAHGKRLRSFIIGGKRLSIIFVLDNAGDELLDDSEKINLVNRQTKRRMGIK